MPVKVRQTLPLAVAVLFSLSVLSGCSLDKQGTGSGSLLVKSMTEASVYVDQECLGVTNQEIGSITAATHTVSVVSEGETLFEAEVGIRSGEPTVVDTDSPEGNPDQSLQDEEQNRALDNAVADPTDEFADEYQALAPTGAQVSVTADFSQRDKLPQTHVPRSWWGSYGSWGPPSADYPAPKMPSTNTTDWKRQRIVAVAKKYMGLPYKHVHIPAKGGLDCSNFTSWVYNYGLGIKFTSAVADQGSRVGRTVSKSSLVPGDLVYFKADRSVVHCAIYVGNGYIIDDSTMNGGRGKVAMKKLNSGWPASHYGYAKRVI